MIQLYYALLIVCQLALLTFSFSQLKNNGWQVWLLRFLIIGVIIDNLTLFLSPTMLGGDAYIGLSRLRYAAHALVLPPLIFFGLSVLQRAGVGLAHNKAIIGVLAVITAGALYFGIHHEIAHLQLGEKTMYSYTRLAAAGDTLPPLGTIATNIVLLIMGAILWWRLGWKWLFLGSLFIFVVNAAAASKEFGLLVGNGAEVLFIASLLITERWVASRKTPDPTR